MVLLQVPKLTPNSEILLPIFIAWLVMGLSAVVILILAKIFHYSKSITGALLLVAVLGNTSFLGIPIVQSYYSQEALGYVMVYDQFGTFLALATYGSIVVALFSKNATLQPKQIITKIIFFPPFVALIIALLLMGTQFPTAIESVLQNLALTIIPLALVAVGLQLKFKLPKPYIKPFSIALCIKLVFAPLIAFSVMKLLGLNSLVAQISILESAMGPMITAAAVASAANLSPRLSSAVVGYGTIFTIITTALWYVVISNFL